MTKAEELAEAFCSENPQLSDRDALEPKDLLPLLEQYGQLVKEAAALQCSIAADHSENAEDANGCARAENYVNGMKLP
jgi:hypothetical protein